MLHNVKGGIIMEDYIVKPVQSKVANYLVFGISADSPLCQLDKIIKSRLFNDGDKILFDQLLQTGAEGNRYLQITIKNGSFDYQSAKIINSELVENNIKIEVSTFLKNHPSILEFCILRPFQKQLIINGKYV